MRQLLIAHDFPPILGAEAIQNSRLIDSLDSLGMNTTVLTRTKKRKDAGINIKEHKVIRAFTLESFFLKGLFYVLCKPLLQYPDTKVSWMPFALKKANKILKNDKVDFVHTWSSPITSHIVALKLKEKQNFKWVAHFSDPWTQNPYTTYYSKHTKKINEIWEQKVYEEADILVFTSKETVDLLEERYGKKYNSKIKILPHTYNQEIIDKYAAINKNNNKIIISHVGHFYGKRTPVELFSGLRDAIKEDKDLINKIEIRLVGRIENQYIQLARKWELSNIVKFIGTIPYEESQKEMAKADILLTVDAMDSISVFLPSKLIEYIGYNKPIIAITPNKGTTSRILNEAGHICYDNSDIKGIEDFFVRLSQKGVDMFEYDKLYKKQYHPEVVAKNFICIVNEIT